MTTPSGSPIIELRNVSKRFGEFTALNGVSLKVMPGERVVVCGPSGSGKSTMIRCINRLEEHDGGQIYVDGVELTEDLDDITSIRREVGMVFQQFNLFPHLTVLENLTLAPVRSRRMPRGQSCSAGGENSPRKNSPSPSKGRSRHDSGSTRTGASG